MSLTLVPLRQTADALMFSRLIWFSQSGSGPAIKAVSAAFLSYEEAAGWAARHPSHTVHFPGGVQLNAGIALANGLADFNRYATTALAEHDRATFDAAKDRLSDRA